MSNAVIGRLCEERDEARSAAIAIAEADEFNPEDKTFVELQTRATELDSRIGALAKLMDDRAPADTFDGKIARQAQQRQQHESHPPRPRQSWGDAFVRSDEFRSYRGRGQSAQFEMDAGLQTRALPTGLTDLVAAGIKPMPFSEDLTAPMAPTPLMDNVTQ